MPLGKMAPTVLMALTDHREQTAQRATLEMRFLTQLIVQTAKPLCGMEQDGVAAR
jgi:hypothetical protein